MFILKLLDSVMLCIDDIFFKIMLDLVLFDNVFFCFV